MVSRVVVLVAVVALAACSPVRRREAVGRCVDRTARDRTACHRECEDDFSASFLGCYGATPCTTRCQGEHAQCQDAPARALQACEGDAADPRSCRARVDAERAGCRTAPRPAECRDRRPAAPGPFDPHPRPPTG